MVAVLLPARSGVSVPDMCEIMGDVRKFIVAERGHHLDHGGAVAETALRPEILERFQEITFALMAQGRHLLAAEKLLAMTLNAAWLTFCCVEKRSR